MPLPRGTRPHDKKPEGRATSSPDQEETMYPFNLKYPIYMHRLIFLVSSRVAWEKTDDEVPDEDHFLGGGGASPPPPSPPPPAAKVRKERTALSPPGSPQSEDGDARHIRKTVSEIFPQGSRRWVDVHFLVFFAALLVVWIYVGIFGFTHGDMARLTHPTVGFLFGFKFSPSRRTFFLSRTRLPTAKSAAPARRRGRTTCFTTTSCPAASPTRSACASPSRSAWQSARRSTCRRCWSWRQEGARRRSWRRSGPSARRTSCTTFRYAKS